MAWAAPTQATLVRLIDQLLMRNMIGRTRPGVVLQVYRKRPFKVAGDVDISDENRSCVLALLYCPQARVQDLD
jgi:hypothetical protein